MYKNKIYIGDNLDVMRDKLSLILKEKIKCIYIDPPYNTLTKKSYKDKENSALWCSFMKDRIHQSLQLMREDGVIFISIDDNEFPSLRLICDNIFGKENFIGTFITKQAERSNAKFINTVHEYIVCYAKNKRKLQPFRVNRMDIPEDKKIILALEKDITKIFNEKGKEKAEKDLKEKIKKICSDNQITWLKNYSNIDEEGRIFFAVDLSTPSAPNKVDIPEINLHLEPLKTRGWASKEKFIQLAQQNRLAWKKGRPYSKLYLREAMNNCPSCLNFFSRQGTNDLKKLGLDKIFDTPKPVELIKFLIRMATDKDDIVLDYFAGSGTTAQAVYELNQEEHRKNTYILIQKKEDINKSSECYKRCQELKINPNMKDILLHRINVYLSKSHQKIDYELEE